MTAPAINVTIGLSGSDFRFTHLPESTRGFIRAVKHPGVRLSGSSETMRIPWTTVKLAIAPVVVVPISIIVVALTLCLLGALVRLLFLMWRSELTSGPSAAGQPARVYGVKCSSRVQQY